jgi:hypothetical protein
VSMCERWRGRESGGREKRERKWGTKEGKGERDAVVGEDNPKSYMCKRYAALSKILFYSYKLMHSFILDLFRSFIVLYSCFLWHVYEIDYRPKDCRVVQD